MNAIASYQNCDLVLTGDLNARTGNGNLQDFLLNDSTDFLPTLESADYSVDDFNRPRISKDKETNSFGLKLLTLCSILNIHIVNGRLLDDKCGEYTCVKKQGASVVDYCIVSTEIFSKITHFCVEPRTESDHFPVEFSISTVKTTDNVAGIEGAISLGTYQKLKLNKALVTKYVQNVQDKVANFGSKFETQIQIDINQATHDFCLFIKECARFMLTKEHPETRNVIKQPPWFDNECVLLKKI